MKIIIIGAGLSGLSTALALRKYLSTKKDTSLNIKVYKKSESKDISENDMGLERRRKLGAGLGLQSNGLRVLNDLDPVLKRKVYEAGFPCTHFKWKTSGDILLGREYVDVLPISRPFLIDCLAEGLPEGIIEYNTVTKFVAQQGQKPVVYFEDGSSDNTADLVIGTDGIRSTVRQAIFGDDERYRPEYLEISAVGGVLDVALPKHLLDDPSMVFFTGSTGVFGYTGLTQSDHAKLLYWSVYESDLPSRGDRFNQDLLLEQLRQRHSHWTDPLISKCLQKAKLDNIYPIFVMPDLPYWGRDGCVLVGDAAHALPPRSGQGSSQAFEDGQTLALLLSRNLDNFDVSTAVSKSIAGLYEVRHPRVSSIRSKATMWKDPKMPMPWWKTYILYAFLFVFVKLRYLISFFEVVDDWIANVETAKYLARE